ncbi:ABC transporter substrate-binding protein [Prescottella defluvii]|uniref:ABC transporter substrate-binding protein n=1 Tax=Prescottella defluvii TaxID=1323361 RepID=UPI0004F29B7B|nr:ABC transporter substrate-binding protein [Prescottella defluvii]
MGSRTRFGKSLTAVMVAGALALAGCASSESSGSGESGDTRTPPAVGLVGEQAGDPTGSTPQLTFSVQALAAVLDPAKTAARGGSGGDELAAVYDVLLRYDGDTNEYEPRLAESLTGNDAGTVWTLKLRPGVTFSDGTPLDANAVVASIDRYNTNKGNGAAVWLEAVESTTAVDPQTVEFRLRTAWPTFPSMLALGHGMIVAPGAGEGEAFKPIGAGPFVMERYAPNEERMLTARADYWNGKPKADKLKFVALSGSRENLESMKTDGIDIGFLRGNPQAIYDTIDAGYPGYFSILNSGGAELVNNREGRPGADVRVRRAIALAIDPELVGQRGDNGLGLPGKAMFNDLSRWATDVDGVPFDPEAARKLLDEAKADGYDGTLNYIVLQEPSEAAIGMAVQSLLQAVGFTVNIINANNAGDIVKQVYVQRDFDMAHAGIGLYEAIPFLGLQTTLAGNSTSNFSGYSNPQMDALLGKLQAADGDDQIRGVLAEIQTLWNETVPSVPVSSVMIYVAWQENVGGVVPTATGIMLLDKAGRN